MPVHRLLTETQRRSHQQDVSNIPEAPFEQPNRVKTKRTMTTDEEKKEEVTDDASHPYVEA